MTLTFLEVNGYVLDMSEDERVRLIYVHALQVSPTDERTVIFGHHGGMLVSHDGGAIWTAPSGAKGDAMGVALPPGSQTQFAAGHDVFMRSDDGGRTWSSVRPALPGTDIHGFAASAVAPNTFYAYVVGGVRIRGVIAARPSWRVLRHRRERPESALGF